ncbi:MAG: ABC-type transport auxiliary lipoprotein family protein [Candidatus Acidiferrales bacterium]
MRDRPRKAKLRWIGNDARLVRPFAFLLFTFALLSCGGTARPSKFYALELPAPPEATGEPHDVSLMVGRIGAPHLYRDDRLVYRTGNMQLGTYEYHRWAEPPTDMLEAMLTRLLRASGKYRSVQTLRSNATGDYIVRGRLHDFEEVATANGLAARVALEVELYERASGTTVWSHFYSHDEAVSGKEVPDVVAALNRNVQAGLQKIAAEMDDYFAANSRN